MARRRERKSSSSDVRYVERGASDTWGSSRFESVVIMNLASVAPAGSLSSICSRREVTVVVGDVRRTKVGGRPRPLKVEMRTLRCSAIAMNGLL